MNYFSYSLISNFFEGDLLGLIALTDLNNCAAMFLPESPLGVSLS